MARKSLSWEQKLGLTLLAETITPCLEHTRPGLKTTTLGSARAQHYEEQVTRAPIEQSYIVNGVEFDGYDGFALIDAKGPGYDPLIKGHWSREPKSTYKTDPVTGEVLSRPEYLLLPATFGLWAMVMLLYIFCSRNACNFLNWWQTLFLGKNKRLIAARPMTRHTSIVTFMEINTMLWTCYLLLMNLYDPQLFGRESPVTFGVAFGALLSAPYVFRKQLHLQSWGANIRMGTATVIVFWIAVEAFNRTGIIGKLIAHPSEYPWHWVVMVIELCFLAGKIVKDARAKKEKK